jgi:hypothetical protein
MVLSIAVLDINDNAPVFKEAEYAARINESAAAGTFVVQVRRPLQPPPPTKRGRSGRYGFATRPIRVNPDRQLRPQRPKSGKLTLIGVMIGLAGGTGQQRRDLYCCDKSLKGRGGIPAVLPAAAKLLATSFCHFKPLEYSFCTQPCAERRHGSTGVPGNVFLA